MKHRKNYGCKILFIYLPMIYLTMLLGAQIQSTASRVWTDTVLLSQHLCGNSEKTTINCKSVSLLDEILTEHLNNIILDGEN